MSVPWRTVQQPPFTRWCCPGGPRRWVLAGWVIPMVPGSVHFSLVAPGGQDCYFTHPTPPFMESKLNLAEVANLGGGPSAVKRGQAQPGPKPRVPVPNPEGQRQPCLTAWAFIHSPWLREAAGSNTGGALPGVILTPCAKDGSSGSSQVVGVGGSRDSTSPAPWRHPSLDPAKGAAEDACRVLFTSSVCLVPRQAGQVGARVVLGEESGRRPGLQDSKAVSPEGPLLRRYEGLPLSVGLGNWNLRL